MATVSGFSSGVWLKSLSLVPHVVSALDGLTLTLASSLTHTLVYGPASALPCTSLLPHNLVTPGLDPQRDGCLWVSQAELLRRAPHHCPERGCRCMGRHWNMLFVYISGRRKKRIWSITLGILSGGTAL